MSKVHQDLQVRSVTRPERWEDAMVSGNGVSGFMSMGGTHAETLVVCHEKCWVEKCGFERKVTSVCAGLEKARPLALAGKYKEAHDAIRTDGMAEFIRQYPDAEAAGIMEQLPVNVVNPALHLLLEMPGSDVGKYERVTVLDRGEVLTKWEDRDGRWERGAFASVPDQVLAVRLRNLDGEKITSCRLVFAKPPALEEEDIRSVTIEHRDATLYYHSVYSRSAGREIPDGYHVMAMVNAPGGTLRTETDAIVVEDASELTVVLRVEFLDRAGDPEPETLRRAMEGIEVDYDWLLERHVARHAEVVNRVRLDLGADFGGGASAEEIRAESEEKGMTPAMLEIMHAMGRYALISSSGELPPALMGIWSHDWDARWGGRFTLDSNLNLAVSAGNQGDMHEAMEIYFGFIEGLLDDWRENARVMFGHRGFFASLVQDWRTAKNPWYRYVWTGAPGWLYSYFWDHYLYTQDETFLRRRVIPPLIEIAQFYEDLTDAMPRDKDGRRIFYPGLSPENKAVNHGEAWNFPNPSVEIAICRQVLTNLVEGCTKLEMHSKDIPHWQEMLRELPDYRILEDGAIAEWSWPDIETDEAHRHASHLYGVYPGTEISRRKSPRLALAARQSIQRRIDGGCSADTGHGLMHHIFFSARLLDVDLFWHFMDAFARGRFMNSSLISCHNQNRDTYNLDITLSMTAIIMEMLLCSEPGMIHLLPVVGDRVKRGRVTGLLARGGIRVDELNWDLDEGVIHGSMTSRNAQTIEVFGPAGFAGSRADEAGTQPWSNLGRLALSAKGKVEFRFVRKTTTTEDGTWQPN